MSTETTDVVRDDLADTLDTTQSVDESGASSATDTPTPRGKAAKGKPKGAPEPQDESKGSESPEPEGDAQDQANIKACQRLYRKHKLGEGERCMALGHLLDVAANHRRNIAPVWEEKDHDALCVQVHGAVALEMALPKDHRLRECHAFYAFRLMAVKEYGVDPFAEKPEGKPAPDRVPWSVFLRIIYPHAITFNRKTFSVEAKTKWDAWLRELLTDIVVRGITFSREELANSVTAERERQRNDGKSSDELDALAKAEALKKRKAQRDGIAKSLSDAAGKAVAGGLMTPDQFMTAVTSAMQSAEMKVPAVGGINPADMGLDDAETLVLMLAHFKKVDVMIRLQSKLADAIVRIQGKPSAPIAGKVSA